LGKNGLKCVGLLKRGYGDKKSEGLHFGALRKMVLEN
jgi:hypothetical protein